MEIPLRKLTCRLSLSELGIGNLKIVKRQNSYMKIEILICTFHCTMERGLDNAKICLIETLMPTSLLVLKFEVYKLVNAITTPEVV